MPRGNVEILACYDDIIKYLNDGNTYRGVYNILAGMNKISISYQRFCDLLRSHNIKKKHLCSIQSMLEDAKSEYNQRIQSLSGLSKHSRNKEKNTTDGQNETIQASGKPMKNLPEQTAHDGKPLFEIKRLGDEAFE